MNPQKLMVQLKPNRMLAIVEAVKATEQLVTGNLWNGIKKENEENDSRLLPFFGLCITCGGFGSGVELAKCPPGTAVDYFV